VSRLLRDILDCIGVELKLGLGDIANESELVGGHLGGYLKENHREQK
jgi:hypothetical protein